MKKKKLVFILIIALLLEVVLFNITSYYALLGKKNEKIYTEFEFVKYDGKFAILKIDNIDCKVYSLKLDLKKEEESSSVVEYKIFYTDDTSTTPRGLNSKMYIDTNEKSKATPLYLSGESKEFLLAIDKHYYDNELINSITINSGIPFEFNVYRFLVVLGILVFVYFYKTSESFNINYSIKNLKQEYILIGVLAVFLIIVSFINAYSSSENKDLFFTTEEGTYNKEFVDSLYNKQLYLLEDPSDEFKSLENPYDALGRDSVRRDVDYKWDTAYFNGHHYIYFGILPAILIFLPFYIFTKKYLKISFVVFIFSVFILVLVKEIFIKTINRYFKEIPFKNVFWGLVSLFSGTLIIYANGISRVYELVIVAGLFFVLLGIYFILKSVESEKFKYLNIFLSAFCLALSVACRPTDLLASIIILPYLISIFINLIKNIKTNKLNLFKLILGVGLPYLSIGIGLMIYNYLRFNNPFEFGAAYQLTINNMGALKSGVYSIPTGLVTNLFCLPRFILKFPFIENSNELISFYGYYYIENMIGGLFMIVPVCFSLFKIFKANKENHSKEFKIITWTLLIVGILIAVISIGMAGSNERYLMDYSWMLVLDGILIFNILFENLKTDEAKKILQKVLCTISIYSFIVAVLAGIVSEKSYFEQCSSEEYYKTRYTICFWE